MALFYSQMQHYMINKLIISISLIGKTLYNTYKINKDSFMKVHNITDFKNLEKVTECKARKQKNS